MVFQKTTYQSKFTGTSRAKCISEATYNAGLIVDHKFKIVLVDRYRPNGYISSV